MGVGPDGACGGSSGGGDSWAHSTAAATRASASETGARTLIMAAGWYHAAVSRRRYHDEKPMPVRVYDVVTRRHTQSVCVRGRGARPRAAKIAHSLVVHATALAPTEGEKKGVEVTVVWIRSNRRAHPTLT